VLSQALEAAADQASAISSTGDLPGAVHTARADAQGFAQDALPAVGKVRDDVNAFAAGAGDAVTGMLAQLRAGQAVENVVRELQGLSSQAEPLRAGAGAALATVTQWRDVLAADSDALVTARTQYQGRLAALTNRRKQLQGQADAIRQRLDIVNALMIVTPLAKLADEIASLVTTGKLTEQQLSDTSAQLQNVQAQSSTVNQAVSQVDSLRTSIGTLSDGAQNVANAISVVTSQLANDADLTTSADASTAVLYLTALQSNLKDLQESVA
jgi:chromosome segregation ATPase